MQDVSVPLQQARVRPQYMTPDAPKPAVAAAVETVISMLNGSVRLSTAGDARDALAAVLVASGWAVVDSLAVSPSGNAVRISVTEAALQPRV